MLSINLNEHVYIIPEERDFINMKEHDDAIIPKEWQHPLSYYKEKVTSEGFLEFQIHSYMEYFGGKSMNGAFLPGKEGRVYFKEEELQKEK